MESEDSDSDTAQSQGMERLQTDEEEEGTVEETVTDVYLRRMNLSCFY